MYKDTPKEIVEATEEVVVEVIKAMNKKDKQKLLEAYRILKKWGGKPCKGYGWSCHQCQIDRFLVEFESLINFYIE